MRVKASPASYIYNAFYSVSCRNTGTETLILHGLHSLKVKQNSIKDLLNIYRFALEAVYITVEFTYSIGITAVLIEILRNSTTKAAHIFTSLNSPISFSDSI